MCDHAGEDIALSTAERQSDAVGRPQQVLAAKECQHARDWCASPPESIKSGAAAKGAVCVSLHSLLLQPHHMRAYCTNPRRGSTAVAY